MKLASVEVNFENNNLHRVSIKELLRQFSDTEDPDIDSDKMNDLLRDTINSEDIHTFLFYDEGCPVAMYVGTVKPAMLSRSLYIDAVVVAKSYRGNRITDNILIPHMKEMAREYGCGQIDLTSSKPGAQKVYRRNGFSEGTVAFRLNL